MEQLRKEEKKMKAKILSKIAILSSLGVVLRLVFGAFPNIKPITAMFFVIALELGTTTAITVSSVTMLVTGYLLGFGPWIIWQILTYMMIIACWSFLNYLFPKYFKKSRLGVSILAGCFAMIYGFVISLFSVLFYGGNFIPYWLNGLFFDFLHAISTAIFYPIIIYIFRRTHEKNLY